MMQLRCIKRRENSLEDEGSVWAITYVCMKQRDKVLQAFLREPSQAGGIDRVMRLHTCM